jgi:hypothetical protein
MRKRPAWKANLYPESATQGIYIGPTQGLSSPKNSRRGCLCAHSNTYSRKCCKGDLIQQGIGSTQSPGGQERGAFSSGFSDGFDT